MTNKKDVIEIVRVGLVLFAITAIAAAILAGVNSFTAPVISENNRIAEETAMKAVLPDASEFIIIKNDVFGLELYAPILLELCARYDVLPDA